MMSDYAIIAKNTVLSTLGEENEYFERIILKQLENEHGDIIKILRQVDTISRNVNSDNTKSKTTNTVLNSDNIIQKVPQNDIKIYDNDIKIVINGNNDNYSNLTEQQIISRWIINSLLKDNIEKKNANMSLKHWKLVNGTLAATLPFISAIIVGVIEYYFIIKTC